MPLPAIPRTITQVGGSLEASLVVVVVVVSVVEEEEEEEAVVGGRDVVTKSCGEAKNGDIVGLSSFFSVFVGLVGPED